MKRCAFGACLVIVYGFLFAQQPQEAAEDAKKVVFAPPVNTKISTELESNLRAKCEAGIRENSVDLKMTIEWTAQKDKDDTYRIDARVTRADVSYVARQKKKEGEKTTTLTFKWSPADDRSLLRETEGLETLATLLGNPVRCRIDANGYLVDSLLAEVYVDPPLGWAFKMYEEGKRPLPIIGLVFSLPELISEATAETSVEIKEGAILYQGDVDIPEVFSSSGLMKITAIRDDKITFMMKTRCRIGPKAEEHPESLPAQPDSDVELEMTWDTAKNLPHSFQGTTKITVLEGVKKIGTIEQTYKVKNTY